MQGPKVLVVDDETDVQDVLRELLSDAGFSVEVASNRNEVRECIKRTYPDVIILDILLGEINGVELYNQLVDEGRLRRSTPVVYLTGLAEGLPPDLPKSGRQFVLMGKPFSANRLLDNLQILVTFAK
jgi:two-component system OmpR family response regulator